MRIKSSLTMKAVNKHDLLSTLENQVERHLQDAIKNFQNMTADELLRPASNGGWSIAQCLEHLNRYGNYYLPQIKKALDAYKGGSSETFNSTWLGSYFTKMMDPRTGKAKVKTFKDYAPPRELDAHAVVAEFLDQQELLLSYLWKSGGVDLNGIRIPISIMKWLKLRLGDVFQFIVAHNERHMVQAKRLIGQEFSIPK